MHTFITQIYILYGCSIYDHITTLFISFLKQNLFPVSWLWLNTMHGVWTKHVWFRKKLKSNQRKISAPLFISLLSNTITFNNFVFWHTLWLSAVSPSTPNLPLLNFDVWQTLNHWSSNYIVEIKGNISLNFMNDVFYI